MSASLAALLHALSDAELARLVPDGVYQRGVRLGADGAVTACEQVQDGALSSAKARVRGSEFTPYTVHLTHAAGSRLRGGCDCVYAEGGSACKHQIALALVWRASLAGEVLVASSAPVAAPTAVSAVSALSAPSAAPPEPEWARFVRSQSAPALAAKLLDWAARLPDLRRDLQAWQRAATPVADSAAAKKVVTALLAAPPDLIEWRKVSAYVRKSQAVLGLLQGWTASDPPIALAAADWALTKLRKVWEVADDSNGEIGGLMGDLAAQWLSALQAAGAQPAAFGEKVDRLWGVDDHHLFDQAAALAAMGPAAAGRYGERVRAAWAQSQHGTDPFGPRWQAKRRLQDFYRASGDVGSEIDLLRGSLRDDGDHIQLIEALQHHDRSREALQAAEAAHRQYPAQRRIEELLLTAYTADGWDAEALALHRAAFDRQPSAAGYHAVLQAAAAAGHDVAAERERLWAVMDAQEGQTGGYLASWLGGVRLAIWAQEANFDAALAWLQTPRNVSPDALRSLGLALPPSHDADAAALFQRALALRMGHANSPYAEELRLVRLCLSRLAPQAGALWLAWLRVEYRAKKRFIEGLSAL